MATRRSSRLEIHTVGVPKEYERAAIKDLD